MAKTSTERPVPESQADEPSTSSVVGEPATPVASSAPVEVQDPAATTGDPMETTGTADTDSEPTPDDAEEVGPKKPVKRFVKYTGTADERILTAKDFSDQGGDGTDKKVVWNRANRFVIESSEFSPAALAYLLDRDGGFEAVDHP